MADNIISDDGQPDNSNNDRQRDEKGRYIPDKFRRQLVLALYNELKDDPHMVRKIARRIDRTPQTVYYLFKQLGIQPPSKPRKTSKPRNSQERYNA